MLTPDQEHTLKTVMEICEAIPHNTKRVHETETINAEGEVVTHIDREEWLESWFEFFHDRIGQEFGIQTD